MNKVLHIAIDGPVAAGKGDIAARLAKELGITYIYTGAMYRALALSCIENHVSTKDSARVLDELGKISITLTPSVGIDASACRVILNGNDVTNRVTQPDVAAGSSDVAVIPEVRKHMVILQQHMANGNSVVMEGRDIGLKVLPDANFKIYLTASLDERAKRRYLQWTDKGITKSLEEVIQDTKDRDYQDMHRNTDPLQKLPDAWELDTTGLNQDQVIEKIKNELTKRHLI